MNIAPRYILGQRVLVSDDLPNGFSCLDSPDALTKPCLIVLGGVGLDNDSDANGLAKRGEILLGRQKPPDDGAVSIFSIKYPSHSEARYWSRIREFNNVTDFGWRKLNEKNRWQGTYHPGPEAMQFVRHFMLPLVAKNLVVSPAGVLGEKRPMPEVLRNLRNVHFLGHSYGALAVQEIGDVLIQDMRALGYDKKEIDAAAAQVFVMTVGNPSKISVFGAPFTQVHVLNNTDATVEDEHFQNITLIGKMRQQAGLTPAQNNISVAQLSDAEDNPANAYLLSVGPFSPGERAVYDKHTLSQGSMWARQHALDDYSMLRAQEVNAYYSSAAIEPAAAMLPTAMRAVLRNAMDNAVGNQQKDAPWTPLPGMKQLLEVRPENKLAFASAETHLGVTIPLHEFARKIDYEHNLHTGRGFS
jgi:hypothetical protein